MADLDVLVVGAGRAGAVHAMNLADCVRAARVTGVVDADRAVARALADRVGAAYVGESLADALDAVPFDAVVVTAPTYLHRELVVAAAEAGKHVFCEKPMALDVVDCDAMSAAADRAGVVLQIAFMRRFQPEFAEAHARIEAGAIGEPMVVKSLTRGPGLPPPWAWDAGRSGGMLAEVTSHDFDTVRWLAGSDVVRVYAEVSNVKGAARGVSHADFYDNAVVTLRFASSALGTVDGTCPADYGYDARVEVLGTEGLLVVGDVRGQPILEVCDRDTGGRQPVYRTWPERFETGYREEIRAFVAAARAGTAPPVTGADGRAAVHAVAAANLSWREDRPVRLAEVAACGP